MPILCRSLFNVPMVKAVSQTRLFAPYFLRRLSYCFKGFEETFARQRNHTLGEKTFISLTQTHTHTHTHTNTHTLSFTLLPIHSLFLTSKNTHSHFYSFTHSLPPNLSLNISHSIFLSLSLSLPLRDPYPHLSTYLFILAHRGHSNNT
jgi:hypothetical protein